MTWAIAAGALIAGTVLAVLFGSIWRQLTIVPGAAAVALVIVVGVFAAAIVILFAS
jgi:RsiW-degrading membrane proteinase PrsW (M82 family)